MDDVLDPATVRILHGPRIETLATADRTGPEAVATCGGRIVGLGTLATLRAAHPSAQVVRIDGALMVPGFNDAHIHPLFAAEPTLRLDLRPEATADLDAVRQALVERARVTPEGQWVVGAGYDVLHPAGGRLDRRVLDAVSTDHPVYVLGSTWHASIANSRALEQIRAEPATAQAPTFTRDEDGELDGWLHEAPHMLVAWGGTSVPEVLPRLPLPALVDALESQNSYLNAAGVTSYTDALVTPHTWAAYERLHREGRATARASLALWHTYRSVLDDVPLRAGAGDEWLRLVGIKVMYDGAISGGTCLCTEPYQGPAGTGTGIRVVSPDELRDLVVDLHGRGLRACVHANGDAAISDVLDAVENARAAHPDVRVAHRIEHCSITDDALIERIAATGSIPVPFSAFVYYHGDTLVEIYSEERAARVARHRSMLTAGVDVAGSSDWPCAPLSVLRGLHSLATRRTSTGRLLGGSERLTLREALGVYTHGSAVATGEEHLKGRIAVGRLADFTVLSEDVLARDESWIDSTEVVSTWVGGRRVF